MTISPQISAQSFLEKMDHENLSNTIVLTKEGYRLDDKGRGSSTLKGIRSAIGYSTLKSVDYLYETNGQAYFLEFSDLLAQYQRIMGTVKNINNSNLNTGDKLQIVKIKQGEIRKELIDKFRDTLLIITKAQKN